jgi:hypothetical protein
MAFTFVDRAPTMEEIICIYLYDDTKPPAKGTLKTWDDVKKLAKPTRQDVEIDKKWFMVHGGGRYMSVALFRVVRRFLAGEGNFWPGTYGPRAVFEKFDVHVPSKQQFALKQYDFGLNDPDFVDRCEVFGSSAFKLNDYANFVVDPYHEGSEMGRREVRNIWVEPVEDNYDYDSDSWEAKISNAIVRPVIDPLKIGRQVVIKFVGNYPFRKDYTKADLPELERTNRLLESQKASILDKGMGFPTRFAKKMEDLYAHGILYAKPKVKMKILPTPIPAPVPVIGEFLPRDAE